MGIYKRNHHWRAEVWIENRRLAVKAGFGTKAEARAWHDEKVVDYRKNPKKLLETRKVQFSELLEKYISIHLPSLSPMSRVRYLVDIEKRIKPFFQYRKLESITPELIESFRRDLMDDLSIKSVNSCINLLFSIFKKGQEWGIVEVNPVRLRALKLINQKYAWWDKKEDIANFLKVSEKSTYHLGFRLALECGLRLGEIVGLSKQDICFDRCYLHIHRQWIDKLGTYGPTKGRKERFVPFHPNSSLKTLLKGAIEKSSHPEAVLITSTGKRVGARKLAGYHFQRVVKEAQVPVIRFHDLRHTFASWYMIEVGDIWSLKGILGHGDVQTTQRYAHLSERHQRMPILPWMVEEEKNSHTFSTPAPSINLI
jgi:integrase